MDPLKRIKDQKPLQYLISIGSIFLISFICNFSVDLTGYREVALILLLAVSILAMIFDIWPVVTAAVFSALLWNFFFIPPLYNFTIGTPEDALLFLMYFVIAMINAVLTSKIRKAEIKAKEKEERENTIKLYNTLLNSLSHELKTPISTIIGAVDTLKETPPNLSDADREELLSEIDTASMRLNRQVENLLNMSRLESGFIRPQLDWCDLNEIINRVVNSYQEEPLNHIIRFETKEAFPLFKLDIGLVEQVVLNLVHNAIQHTPEGSVISIDLSHDAKSCIISVSDDGPGFPEGERIAVFEKFYRLPGTKAGGTGLGLSIVKGFVEAHHGKVTIDNLPQGGAKVTIRIPAEASFLTDIHHE